MVVLKICRRVPLRLAKKGFEFFPISLSYRCGNNKFLLVLFAREKFRSQPDLIILTHLSAFDNRLLRFSERFLECYEVAMKCSNRSFLSYQE